MKVAIEQFKSGSAQLQLPIKDLGKITFNFIEDEEKILRVSVKLREIESAISSNYAEIHKLKEMARLLLQKLSR